MLVKDENKLILSFSRFCAIDERFTKRVSKDYKNIASRFLKHTNWKISKETIRAYLFSYLKKKPRTYNNQLSALRVFIGRFLQRTDLIDGFRKAHEGNNDYEIELPNKAQIKIGFEGLTDGKEKAIYLFYASTGLRRTEVLRLNRFEDIDVKLRMVTSKHNTRTKKAGITFYNRECEKILKEYLDSRKDTSKRLFRISDKQFRQIWKKASKNAQKRITPQVLRKWQSTELGELGVPDRYVDIFQGRAPRSVLAKHYTGKGLERLKRIYDKAELKILS